MALDRGISWRQIWMGPFSQTHSPLVPDRYVSPLQCHSGWRPTAAWCRRCVSASSGRGPTCQRSAASGRRTTRGYGSPLSPSPSTRPPRPLLEIGYGGKELDDEDAQIVS